MTLTLTELDKRLAEWQQRHQVGTPRWPKSEREHAAQMAEAIRRVLRGEHEPKCMEQARCTCWKPILHAVYREYLVDHPGEVF